MDTIFKYKKVHPEAKIQMPVYQGDCGYDICSVEEKWIPPLGSAIFDVGLIFEPPEGFYFTVETRSGHGIKHGLRLHRGIIDNGYRKTISIKVYNHGFTFYKVKKGEKIAQLVLHPICVFPLKEVKEVSQTERGERGLGSTGK